MKRLAVGLGAGWLVGVTSVAVAFESPEALVHGIYDEIVNPQAAPRYWFEILMAPENRHDYFTPEIIRVLEINYAHELGPHYSCLETVQPMDGNSYDEFEIQRTLQIESWDEGGRRLVDARFINEGRRNHLRYEFVQTPGGWRIADIATPAPHGSYWRLSELSNC